MNKSVAQYRRALKSMLPCQGPVRRRLMDEFGGMLDSFLEDNPSPTPDELRAAFGSPEEMARHLSANISAAESLQYSRGVVAKKVLAIVLVVLLALATVYVFILKQKPIYVVDELIPTDVIPIPTETQTF